MDPTSWPLPFSVQKAQEAEKTVEKKIREMREKDKEISLKRLELLRKQVCKSKTEADGKK